MKEKDRRRTEVRIRETAKRIFFTQGRLHATLQELASEAGVNKALLHYYYRDRDNLLDVVYREAIGSSFIRMFEILTGEGDFEDRVEAAVHHMCDRLAEFPFIESFIVSTINSRSVNPDNFMPLPEARSFLRKFRPDIRSYLKKRRISISPEEFIINLMALCAYPPSIKPVACAILGYSDAGYKRFLKKRRNSIADLVLMRVSGR